ncbi:cyclin-Q [Zonotrichia leucophrys gambelii]|uniref:cyclin-Q n=1 Tax=Zonotrichia leucophrys gambelii TaxID=257770 RepID=UPI00314032B8
MTSPTRALTSRGPPEPGGAEARARFRIARFIMEAGVKLGLGSPALSTACASFHAFAAAVAGPGRARCPGPDWHLVAAAALFVAAKAQGTPRRARDVLNVTLRCLQPGSAPPALDGEFWQLRDSLLQCELLLLRVLRFRLPQAHPHRYLLQYLLALGRWAGGPWGRVPGVSWALLRDGAAGGLGLRHPPPHLAAAALHLGLELCGRGAPPGTPPRWWQVLSPGLTPAALEGIERELLALYSLDTQVGGGAATPAPPPLPPPLPPSALPEPPPHPPRRAPPRQTEPPPHKRTDRRSPPSPTHGQRDPPRS